MTAAGGDRAAWLTPLPDAAAQRETDRWAIEDEGVPSLELMDNAGRGLAELAASRLPDGKIAVLVGKGNNGGDGLVAARILRERGLAVEVLAAADLAGAQGDPKANLERLPGEPPVPFTAERLAGAAGAIDALLGTGFAGAPREPLASVIAAVGAWGGPVVAADVPSGVDASTGEVAGEAIDAVATATFHAGKPGLWIHPGKAHAGEVEVIEIGIPRAANVSEYPRGGGDDRRSLDTPVGLIAPAVLDHLPERGATSTKFSEGAVLICGGSRGLTGAPSMASEAAQRAGAGYVTAAIAESVSLVLELRLLEAMTVALPDDGGALTPAAADTVLEHATRVQAVVLGPGLGRTEGTQTLARDLAQRIETALLLDADGLNAHAGRLEDLATRTAPTVLTPHAGELARLLETDSETIGAARLRHVREAAARARAIVVLKGDDTLVAEPGGRVGVSHGASPALATAGTGDVLSGTIGALLAKRLDPFHAACAGVVLHARAGQIAAERIGADAVLAHDVIDALAAARRAGDARPASDARPARHDGGTGSPS